MFGDQNKSLLKMKCASCGLLILTTLMTTCTIQHKTMGITDQQQRAKTNYLYCIKLIFKEIIKPPSCKMTKPTFTAAYPVLPLLTLG